MSDQVQPSVETAQVSSEPRYRLNAKQTAKGAWQLDVTAETYDGESPVDLALSVIQEAQKKFEGQGLAVVS